MSGYGGAPKPPGAVGNVYAHLYGKSYNQQSASDGPPPVAPPREKYVPPGFKSADELQQERMIKELKKKEDEFERARANYNAKQNSQQQSIPQQGMYGTQPQQQHMYNHANPHTRRLAEIANKGQQPPHQAVESSNLVHKKDKKILSASKYEDRNDDDDIYDNSTSNNYDDTGGHGRGRGVDSYEFQPKHQHTAPKPTNAPAPAPPAVQASKTQNNPLPDPFKEYVRRVFAAGQDDIDNATIKSFLSALIKKSLEDGSMHTRNWNEHPIPELPSTEKLAKVGRVPTSYRVAPPRDHQGQSNIFAAGQQQVNSNITSTGKFANSNSNVNSNSIPAAYANYSAVVQAPAPNGYPNYNAVVQQQPIAQAPNAYSNYNASSQPIAHAPNAYSNYNASPQPIAQAPNAYSNYNASAQPIAQAPNAYSNYNASSQPIAQAPNAYSNYNASSQPIAQAPNAYSNYNAAQPSRPISQVPAAYASYAAVTSDNGGAYSSGGYGGYQSYNNTGDSSSSNANGGGGVYGPGGGGSGDVGGHQGYEPPAKRSKKGAGTGGGKYGPGSPSNGNGNVGGFDSDDDYVNVSNKQKGKKKGAAAKAKVAKKSKKKIIDDHWESSENLAILQERKRKYRVSQTSSNDNDNYKSYNMNEIAEVADEFNPDIKILGTCEKLEKFFLRLTSAPKAEVVRPAKVIRLAMENLVARIANEDIEKEVREKASPRTLSMEEVHEESYIYICSQFKAMRQDLMVQHITDELFIEVFEAHARIALDYNDFNEFHQCQTQLKNHYSTNVAGSECEFIAYRCFYLLSLQSNSQYKNGNIDMLNLLQSLTEEQEQNPFIQHALKVRESLHTENYYRFFKLYRTTPNKGAIILDHFVSAIRLKFMKRLFTAYKPGNSNIDVVGLLQMLGFDDYHEDNHDAGMHFLQQACVKFAIGADLVETEWTQDASWWSDPELVSVHSKLSLETCPETLDEDDAALA